MIILRVIYCLNFLLQSVYLHLGNQKIYLFVYLIFRVIRPCLFGLGEEVGMYLCMCGHVCYFCCSSKTLRSISCFPILKKRKQWLREVNMLPPNDKHLTDLSSGFMENMGRPSSHPATLHKHRQADTRGGLVGQDGAKWAGRGRQ